EARNMYSDYLVELTPAGEMVWEWRTWEHLDPVADGIERCRLPGHCGRRATASRSCPMATSSQASGRPRPLSESRAVPQKSYGSLVRRPSPASMRRPCWGTAMSSYSITAFI